MRKLSQTSPWQKAKLGAANNSKAAAQIAALREDWDDYCQALRAAGIAAHSSLSVAVQHLRKVRASADTGEAALSPLLEHADFEDTLRSGQRTTQQDARRALSTFYFMRGEPQPALEHNQAVLDLFLEAPHLVERYPARYLTALQNTLIDHFQLQNWAKLENGLQQLRQLPKRTAFLLHYLQLLLNAPGPRQRRALLNEWRHQIKAAQLTEREGRFYEYLDLEYWIAPHPKGKH